MGKKKGLGLAGALAAAMILLAAWPARAEVAFTGYDEALAAAARDQKHVMLYFWADWCQYCAKFNREILPDEKIARALNDGFVSVQIDIGDDPQGLARKYNARSMPTIVFLKPNGEMAGYLPGYLPPPEFLEILNFVSSKGYEKTK